MIDMNQMQVETLIEVSEEIIEAMEQICIGTEFDVIDILPHVMGELMNRSGSDEQSRIVNTCINFALYVLSTSGVSASDIKKSIADYIDSTLMGDKVNNSGVTH